MNDKKKVLSIADTQADAKRKEFNAALNAAVKMMPSGCGIVLLQEGCKATFQFQDMNLKEVVGDLELVKIDVLMNPEGTQQ